MPNSIKLSTLNQKNRECISAVRVYSNNKGEIKGLHLEYDDHFKNDLIPSDAGELIAKIDLHLKVLDDLDGNGELEEFDIRDFVSHIFGTYTNKIEFLGLKCASGKMYYTGNPSVGDPFLLGEIEKRFHYIKLGLNPGDGIAYIRPFFVDSEHYNHLLQYNVDEIEEMLKEEDHLICDEHLLVNIKDPKEYERQALVPLLDDHHFFHHDEDDCHGDPFHELCSQESFCSSEEEGEEHHHHHHDHDDVDILMGLEDDDEDVDDVYVFDGDDNFEDDKRFNVPLWDKVSTKSLDMSSLFKNQTNLERFIEKFRDEIKGEINSLRNNKNKIQNLNNNFYENYLRKDQVEQRNKDPVLKLDLDKFEKEFNRLTRKLDKKNDDEDEEDFSYMYSSHYEGKTANADIFKRWRKFAEYLKRKVVRVGINGAFGASKALDILKSFEDDTAHTIPLDDKVKVYGVLMRILEEKKAFHTLGGEKTGKSFIRRKILQRLLKDKEGQVKTEESKKIQNERKSTEHKPLPKKYEDIKVLNLDIAKIEETIKKGDKRKAVFERLDELKRVKSEMVRGKIEEKQKEISTKNDVNLEKLKKEEIEKRQKIIEKKKTLVQEKKNKETEEVKTQLHPTIALGEMDLGSDIEIYRSQEIVKGKEYTDPLFPANMQSLCPFDEKNQCWILPKDIEDEDVQDWENYKWDRIDKIFGGQDYQVFLKGIEAADIIQGSLGDCYFLSAIAALCKFPELVEKLFLFKSRSEDRCYGVYLRINGLWELVLLDDYVPCYGNTKKKFAFSNAHGKEMWVVLLEKAWAKVNGSYAKTIAGQPYEVFDCITNAYSETITVTNQLKDEIWAKLKEGQVNNFIMTAGTGGGNSRLNYEAVQLVEGHAYTCLGVEEVTSGGVKTKLVKLRNPWGNGEWSGDWSDDSNKWTPQLKQQLLGEGADDGVFFMSYDDFIKYYVVVSICKIHRDYVYSHLKYKKGDTLTPKVMDLVVPKATRIYIQIHQKNPRFKLADGKYHDAVLTFIMLVDENLNWVKSTSTDLNNSTIEMDIQPGTYHLYADINYRFLDKNDLHGYNITTYSKEPVTLSANDQLNYIDVYQKALKSYCRSQLEPQFTKEGTKGEGFKVYTGKNYSTEFPFVINAVENCYKKTKVEASYTSNSGKGKKQSCFFPETEFENKDSVKKVINPGDIELFNIIKFKPESRVEYSRSVSTVLDGDSLEKLVLEKGVKEALDNEGEIIQYYYEHSGGYGLIIENKARDTFKLKLVKENLSWNGKNENEVKFDLKGRNKMFFDLRVIPNSPGASFQFEFDE